MELRLEVLTSGRRRDSVITVTQSPFLIGRDAECHLRPASATVSGRQCALLLRDGKAFVEDFDSTNGTFINDRQIKGVVELLDGDRLRIGPLKFRVCLNDAAPVLGDTPIATEEEAAALLLSFQEEDQTRSASTDFRMDRPNGTTVHDMKAAPVPMGTWATRRRSSSDMPFGTVSSAREILKRYKRSRS